MGGPGPGPGPAPATDALRPRRGQVAAAPRPAPGQRPRAGSWPCPGPGAVLPWGEKAAPGAGRLLQALPAPEGAPRSRGGRSCAPSRAVAWSLTATGGSAEQVGAVLSTCVSSHGSSLFVQAGKYRG